MPIISIANPKGGTGKSTTALILATTLAAKGTTVHAIDCDPNHALGDWAGHSKNPLTVSVSRGQDHILDEIDESVAKNAFTVIDLEGTASSLVTKSLAVSDFVIVPMQGSFLDSRQGARAVKIALDAERMSRRRIPVRVLMTRTSAAIQSRHQTAIMQQLRAGAIEIFETTLTERAAFRHLFPSRLSLDEMSPDEIGGLDKARANATAFAKEVFDWIMEKTANVAA